MRKLLLKKGCHAKDLIKKKELTTDNSFEKRISEIREFLPNFPSAYNRFKETGADTVGSAFDLANILHTEGSVAEASEFYRLAFDLHDKRPDHYPLAQSLLQARLLCLLKAGKKVPKEEILELESLCIPYANYIRGVSLAWQEQEPEEALKTIGNAFEEFHTGEEIDSIYFEIASNFFGRKVGENLNNNQIPYKLYMYWDNNPPNEILSNFEYHSTLAGLPVKVFDREEASEWLYQNYGIEARELFLNARHPAEAADFLRVHIINRLGGWWLDADLKLKDENTLKFMKAFQGSGCYFTTKNNVIHNDFFGSTSNNLILNDCLLSLYRNSYLHKGLFIAYKTGPGVFNRAFSRLYHNFLYNGLVPPSTQIHKQDSFNTYIEEFDTPYKHTNPHWQNA
ncbi:glycosyltransferase family 32 protein [Gluconobacter roseus]|uniref:Uncharacterized protein n=1 Tax=Gluconobacter roseus NBRC 3990 TaxID=1307950 RepID=A0A4Y3M521_9PROT|nr:hypothetical protein [Gluconobacter roseus]GBR43928.1 hypothetical protein AA3990_0584 [Gluconobacter roseus NBRC 3990]GEB02448.1 hypothetical protein GRO01_00240 [Gluconobacter roseus NBRC 3990]GLP92910.1 hypothetical protein GCM10007871_08880 [Gluconobacter roseus NBRC 3990]